MNPAIERLLGHCLRWRRAGDDHLLDNDPDLHAVPATLVLDSPAFANSDDIPRRHAGTGVGDNLSPPLHWRGIPEGTAELALVMQDPDAPLARPVVHLIATGLDAGSRLVAEGMLTPPGDGRMLFGRGSFGRVGYAGPRPVRGHGAHRYVFQLFALSRPLGFRMPPDLDELRNAMRGAVLARGRLLGRYERP